MDISEVDSWLDSLVPSGTASWQQIHDVPESSLHTDLSSVSMANGSIDSYNSRNGNVRVKNSLTGRSHSSDHGCSNRSDPLLGSNPEGLDWSSLEEYELKSHHLNDRSHHSDTLQCAQHYTV